MIGTPRQNSMKITDSMRITGSSRLAAEREQDAERDRDQAGIDRDEEGQHQPAPFARLDEAQAEAAGEQPDAERRQRRRSAATAQRAPAGQGLPAEQRDADDAGSAPARSTRQRSAGG